MAPFDNPYSSKLVTKLSPLIEGQVPDFVQSDHEVFVRFLKHYYQFLEAGELGVTVDINNLLLELETESFLLDESGNKIVSEDSGGKFIAGETITGGTSNATATILVDDLENTRLFISSQQLFETGETVTGGTSSATGTITSYRANPIQTIQQLLAYADVDNTVYEFLDQFRESFMNAIPENLATGVNKRNLIKNIRELYRAKGTKEGHKIFIRMLLDENAEIFYPEKYMLRASGGKWNSNTIIRTTPGTGAVGTEIHGKVVTGQTSGATGLVINSSNFSQGGTAIIEFEIGSISGTFSSGETITAISTVQDVSMSFTIKNIVSSASVSNNGILYSVGDKISLDSDVGNGVAEVQVSKIKEGSVSGVVVDDAGTKYEVGDVVTFASTESNVAAATGFVSIIDGSIQLNGTDSDSTNAGDYLVYESGTNLSLVSGDILLDGTDSIGSNAGSNLRQESGVAATGMGTPTNSNTEATMGSDIEQNTSQISIDSYGTDNDQIAFELGTDSSGGITKVHLKDGGAGYTSLPTISVTSNLGTSTVLSATTKTIGAVDEIDVVDSGFDYSEAPALDFRANFILKDVTGTFIEGNTLTTHTGVVKDWNATTKVLETTFEDVVRTTLETGDSEEILLEDSLRDGTNNLEKISIENILETGDQIVDADGNRIVLDSEGYINLEFILLESGTKGATSGSALIMETPDEIYYAPLRLNATDGSLSDYMGHIANEDGSGDVILEDTGTNLGATSNQKPKFVMEESGNAVLINDGSALLTNGFVNDDLANGGTLLLNGTDSDSTDAGGALINESQGNHITLNGTDSDSSNANSKMLQNVAAADGSVAIDGTALPTTDANDSTLTKFVLNGTDSDSTNAGDKIILEYEPSGETLSYRSGWLLDEDSSVLVGDNAGDNIIHQDAIDFSGNDVTITDSGGASGTIVNADIAKGSVSVDITSTEIGTYGTNIQSRIGEDLIRIQDSYYYQQFSYEVQTGFGTGDYMNELKKALHPAGFEAFGKVTVATALSAAITTTAAGLPEYTADTETYSPILASTLEGIFDVTHQRRFYSFDLAPGNFDDTIVAEDGEDATDDNAILLDATSVDFIVLDGTDGSSTDAGDNILLNATDASSTDDGSKLQASIAHSGSLTLFESGIFDSTDFNIVLNGTDSSSSNAGAKISIILEEFVDGISHNITLDGTEDAHINQPDAGGRISLGDVGSVLITEDNLLNTNILLNGTDASSTNAGDNLITEEVYTLELEDSHHKYAGKTLIGAPNTGSVIINEDNGIMRMESSGRGMTSNGETSVVSFVTTRIGIPSPTPKHLSTGLITLGREPFGGTDEFLELEIGTGTGKNEHLLLSGNRGGSPLEGRMDKSIILNGTSLKTSSTTHENAGDNILLEAATDSTNSSIGSIILDGTDHSGANARDFLVSEIGENIAINNTANNIIISEDALYYGPTDVGDKFMMESSKALGGSSATLEDLKDLQISDIITPSKIIIDNFGGEGEDIGLLMEDAGAIVLNGTDSDSSDAGDNFLLEGSSDYRYYNGSEFAVTYKLILESQYLHLEEGTENNLGCPRGTIPKENYKKSSLASYTQSNKSVIVPYTRSADITTIDIGALHLEDEADETTTILLESGGGRGGGILLLNGTTKKGADDGDSIKMEKFFDVPVSHGTGAIVMNGTDGSSTNAGDEFMLEAGTLLNFVIEMSKSGAITYPSAGAWDSSSSKFDSSSITFDST